MQAQAAVVEEAAAAQVPVQGSALRPPSLLQPLLQLRMMLLWLLMPLRLRLVAPAIASTAAADRAPLALPRRSWKMTTMRKRRKWLLPPWQWLRPIPPREPRRRRLRLLHPARAECAAPWRAWRPAGRPLAAPALDCEPLAPLHAGRSATGAPCAHWEEEETATQQ